MSYCPHCGTQLSNGATFCSSCGAPINTTAKQNSFHQSTVQQDNVFNDYFVGVIKKYAVFEGRARRKEYWMFQLFYLLISVGFLIIDSIAGTLGDDGTGVFNTLYSLAILLPSLGVAIRRMHDVNKSGWFILVPFYNLILMCTDGTPGMNRFGSDPKGRV